MVSTLTFRTPPLPTERGRRQRTSRITGSKTSANGSPAERLSLTRGQIKRDGDAINFFFLILFGGPACTRPSSPAGERPRKTGAGELGKQTRKSQRAGRAPSIYLFATVRSDQGFRSHFTPLLFFFLASCYILIFRKMQLRRQGNRQGIGFLPSQHADAAISDHFNE